MNLSIELHTGSPEDTLAVGRALGEQARPDDVILLSGPLGAGKTCLTQGIALGLGVEGYVRSPTFVLMTRHSGRLMLHHLDLYRISSYEEAWDLGLDEQLTGGGVCVVEWAERAEELFPDRALWVRLAYSDPALDNENKRILDFSGGLEHHQAVLEELASVYPPHVDPPNDGIKARPDHQPDTREHR